MHGEGGKRLTHPTLGPLELEYSAFAVDGRPDLGMIVYNPVDSTLADRIWGLVNSRPTGKRKLIRLILPAEPPGASASESC